MIEVKLMPHMRFLSIRELQQQGSALKDILDDDGRIVITSNGKPIGVAVGVDESSFEEILDDWRRVRQLRYLRNIDRKLDASERIAAGSDAEWLDDEEFWAGTEASI